MHFISIPLYSIKKKINWKQEEQRVSFLWNNKLSWNRANRSTGRKISDWSGRKLVEIKIVSPSFIGIETVIWSGKSYFLRELRIIYKPPIVGRRPISELDLTASEFQTTAQWKNIVHPQSTFICTLHLTIF